MWRSRYMVVARPLEEPVSARRVTDANENADL